MTWLPERYEPRAVPARSTSRQLARQVGQIRSQALVRAAKAEAIGFVATIGLHVIDGVTGTEGRMIQHNPLGEPRYKDIGDTAALAVAQVVAGMIWQ